MAVLVATSPALAQSINVSFGHTSGGPSDTYGAAGAVGTWNAVSGISGSNYSLVAIDGSTTSVVVSQQPNSTVLTPSDSSAVTGDAGALLNNGLVTTDAETCLSFTGVTPGMYELLIYAWLPDGGLSDTRQDEAPAKIPVGGAWTGEQQELVTYARYVVTVASDGTLPGHSGLVTPCPVGSTCVQAALNGVQFRPLADAVDAGTKASDSGGGGGGGGADQVDGGVAGSGDSHHGGCSVVGSGGDPRMSFALALVVLGAVRRRRR